MPGYVKIGYTSRVPDDRATELSAPTGIPQPFVLEYWCLTEDCEKAEAAVHQALDQHRINSSREFFQLHITEAISLIDGVLKPAPSRYVRSALSGSKAQSVKTGGDRYGRCQYCGGPIVDRLCWTCGAPG